MFNICIVDNNNESRKSIIEQIESVFAEYDIAFETDAMEYGTLISPEIWLECNYDLAIFDISDQSIRNELMAYSIEIRKLCQRTKVVFVSDDMLCALDIFEYNPDYFIFKPQMNERLPSAMEHLFRFELKNSGNNLIISTKSAKHIIPERTILYFEHYQHNTKIICEDKVIVCHEKLSTLLDRLDDRLFARCHCSFIVNLQHVREFRRTQLLLSNGDAVPCSRSNQKSISRILSEANAITI